MLRTNNQEWLEFAMSMYKKLHEMGFIDQWSGPGNIESLFNLAKEMNFDVPNQGVSSKHKKGLFQGQIDHFWGKEAEAPGEAYTTGKDDGENQSFPISIYESTREVTLHVIMPGIAGEKDLTVIIGDGSLTFTGIRTSTGEGKVESFRRTVMLPASVDPSGSVASYKNGFLHISIPKKQKSSGFKIKVNFQ